MRVFLLTVLSSILAAFGAMSALAEGERAGAFDYYVMSLSWTPTWCATTGDARQDPQCRTGRHLGFTLHGLWPQFDSGYPSYCRTTARDPSQGETGAMADIMGSGGLAWYEWKKHGRCTGLAASDYFSTSRAAYGKVRLPPVLQQLGRDVRLPAHVVEDAFVEANPGLSPNAITVSCDQGQISEVRVCLTKSLDFRDCGADAARDCRMPDAGMDAPR